MRLETINEIRSELPDLIRHYFPVQVWSLQELGGYQNWVYQMSCHDRPYIVRVTPASHRPLSLLKAEISFVNGLYERGIPVAASVTFSGTPTIQRVKLEQETCFLTVFEKAAGLRWDEVVQTETHYHEAGRVLGMIHRESRQLAPQFDRPLWEENHYIRTAKRVIPHEKRWVLYKMVEHIARLRELSQDREEFGLVHGDYHYANMLYRDGGITVFDFDEVEYHWYAYDLAVYLFYHLLGSDPSAMAVAEASRVWTPFLRGYAAEHSLPDNLMERLDDFLRLREFMLYSSIYGSVNRRPWDAWRRRFIAEADRRFQSDRPFVDLDLLATSVA